MSFDEGTSKPRSLKAPAAGTAPAGAFAFSALALLSVEGYAPAVLTRSLTHPTGFIDPCLPTLAHVVPDGSRWAFEANTMGFGLSPGARANGFACSAATQRTGPTACR